MRWRRLPDRLPPWSNHRSRRVAETAEVFVHGLCQAFMKRGLPRSLMSDNGSPMLAGEVAEGLHRLGIVHARTLSRAPHMNGKCEVFWALVEGRLMAMLESVEPLTLKRLNDATVSWLEQDYHRRVHRELGVTPHTRLAESPDASRPCPGTAELRDAFRIERTRTVRRSDATVSVGGVRYQLPAPWRHLRDVRVRYVRWDLAGIDLVDDRTGDRLCTLHPLDKRANAAAVRRPVRSDDDGEDGAGAPNEPAPLLGRILDEQAATGLAPAWLAHPDSPADDRDPGEAP